jgi:cysteinyl-tRNA synthetase
MAHHRRLATLSFWGGISAAAIAAATAAACAGPTKPAVVSPPAATEPARPEPAAAPAPPPSPIPGKAIPPAPAPIPLEPDDKPTPAVPPPAPREPERPTSEAVEPMIAAAKPDESGSAEAESQAEAESAVPRGGRPRGPGRGFPEAGPWVSFYGPSRAIMPLEKVAKTFRIINIDADPGVGAFTPAQIKVLKNGGRNRVISYMNVGSCENFREYFKAAPRGMVPCKENLRAQRGRYSGYPTEIWMDPSNPDYQTLIVDHVALRLARTGVDGFYLDNLEILEHGEQTSNGPCGPHCRQGGLELVARLRKAFPDHLIVMQNATSDVTRLARTESGPYPALLDGIAHEQIFAPQHDAQALTELLAWKAMDLTPGGQPFFIGVEDYVGDCTKIVKAKKVYAASRAHGFSPYASDASAGQQRICYWGF